MKTCTGCGERKPLGAFAKHPRGRLGLQARCRDCFRRYRASRPRDEQNAERRAAYAANPEPVREKNRAYFAANPHHRWVAKYRQRARRYRLPVVVERFTRSDVVALYSDACAHCGGLFEELDHFPVAVVNGGTHTLDNVRPSCRRCNRPGINQTRIVE